MNTIKHFCSAGILIFVIVGCTKSNTSDEPTQSPIVVNTEQSESEAWHMEELYWEYVQNIDTISYKKLWHDDFIGYPSFGVGVSSKKGIAVWIPDLHKDPDLKFSYELHKIESNAIDDVVLVFYDADEIWTNKEGQVVRKETYKLTHTWKKYGDTWLILGGMAAKKNQDTLSN